MTDSAQTDPSTHREVSLERVALGRYEVTNARGGSMILGDGNDEAFSPVEALLAAIAGCSSVDVDHLTSRRAEPTRFEVTSSGDKVSVDGGNVMTNLRVTFHLEFPEGTDGDQARARIDAAITASHDRLCTVSRTVELPSPVVLQRADELE